MYKYIESFSEVWKLAFFKTNKKTCVLNFWISFACYVSVRPLMIHKTIVLIILNEMNSFNELFSETNDFLSNFWICFTTLWKKYLFTQWKNSKSRISRLIWKYIYFNNAFLKISLLWSILNLWTIIKLLYKRFFRIY